MPTIYVNPYTVLGLQQKAGLDAVLRCLLGSSSSSSSGGPTPTPPNVTVEQLITCTVNYIAPIYGTNLGPIELLELNLIIADSINGYINANAGGYLNYNEKQQKFIFQMVEGINPRTLPVISVKDYLVNIEENITKSGLDSNGQAPLLMATAIGKATYDYILEGEAGLHPGWGIFDRLNHETNPVITVYGVIQASMEGALLGATTTSRRSSVLSSASSIGTDAVSALTAGIALTAGKYLFTWLPRVTAIK